MSQELSDDAAAPATGPDEPTGPHGTAAPREATGPDGSGGSGEATAPTEVVGPQGDAGRDEADGQAPRRCVACGWSNLPYRELCNRCGADLDTGVVPPWPLEPAPTGGSQRTTPAPRARRRVRWWVPVVGVVGVVAVVVAALAFTGIGPFASDPDVPAASFDAGRYEAVERGTLAVTEVATMTTAEPDQGRSFTASQLVDGSAWTAWRSAQDQLPEGISEKVDLVLASPAWVDELRISNGDQRDADSYAELARVRRARLTFDGDEQVIVNLLDIGRSEQLVTLPEPHLTTAVRIEILEVFPGTDGDSVAVSDLALVGRDVDAEDADLAAARAEARPAAGTATSTGTNPLGGSVLGDLLRSGRGDQSS